MPQNWVPQLFPPSHSLRTGGGKALGEVCWGDSGWVGDGVSRQLSSSLLWPALQKWCCPGEQVWVSQAHASNGGLLFFLAPSRNELSYNPPSGPVLSTVELLVQWKHHNLLRENISLYPHKTSNTCLEGFLHPWLLTCKCKKRRKKMDVIKRKGGTALNSSGAVGNLKPPLAVGALPTLLELCPPGRTCLESLSGWAQLGSAPSEELRHQVRRQEPTLTMNTAEPGVASLGLCCFDLVPHRHFCSFRSLAESRRLVPTGAQY